MPEVSTFYRVQSGCPSEQPLSFEGRQSVFVPLKRILTNPYGSDEYCDELIVKGVCGRRFVDPEGGGKMI